MFRVYALCQAEGRRAPLSVDDRRARATVAARCQELSRVSPGTQCTRHRLFTHRCGVGRKRKKKDTLYKHDEL